MRVDGLPTSIPASPSDLGRRTQPRKTGQESPALARLQSSLLFAILSVSAVWLIPLPAGAQGTPYYAAIWEEDTGLPWAAYHGMTDADFQSRFDQYVGQGYRLSDVSGYSVNGVAQYAAIWEKRDGPAWVAHYRLTAADYQSRFNQYTGEGYRPVHVTGYGVNGVAYYATIWEQNDGRAWASHHGLTAAEYQSRFHQYVNQGYRLTDVSGYAVDGVAYYAAIWEQRAGPAWVAHHGLTAAEYESRFKKYLGAGYRLVRVSGYSIQGETYYSAIWEKNDGRAWGARHGLSAADYQTRFDQYASQGYRVVHVNGYEVNDARYATIWEQNDGRTWVGEHQLSAAEYQNLFGQYLNQGYRLVDLEAYTVNDVPYYAAIWEQRAGPAWVSEHAMTFDEFRNYYTQYEDQGYRAVRISPYVVSGAPMYAAIWEMNDGRAWKAEPKLSSEAFQNLFDKYSKEQGFRLIDLDACTVNDVPYYAAVWEKPGGPGWAVSHVMAETEYLNLNNEYIDQGYRLTRVSPYAVSGFPIYAASWEMNDDGRNWVSDQGLTDAQYRSSFTQHVSEGYRLRSVSGYVVDRSVPPVPAIGKLAPALAPFDDAMKRFVGYRNIPASAICVSRGKHILLERGYGWQDSEQTVPLTGRSLFRIASLTKPITQAAIQRLVYLNHLSLDDYVFDLGQPEGGILKMTPPGGPRPYFNRITVRHLLEHQGGWDRGKSGDPMFNAIAVAQFLGVPSPPSQLDTVQYVMMHPLDFYPGSKTVYSNFGYLLLGLIIEQIEGDEQHGPYDYTKYIQGEILKQLGVASRDVMLGRSLPGFRNEREPWYSDPYTASNVFNPAETVPYPDGGFYLEAMEAHGGLISTPRAYAKFLGGYWLDGFPRKGETRELYFLGSLPGTYALARQRADGVNIVVFFNQRADDDSYSVIKSVMDSAADISATLSAMDGESLGGDPAEPCDGPCDVEADGAQ